MKIRCLVEVCALKSGEFAIKQLTINRLTNHSIKLIMKKILLLLSLSIVVILSANAATFPVDSGKKAVADTAKPAAAPSSPVNMPGMAGPLSINPEPLKIFKDVYVSGVASALAQVQSNQIPGDKPALTDVSNAQIFIQKPSGIFQFFLQFGGYSLPDLGTPYLRAGLAPNAFYGLFPQGYVKIAPTSSFSIEAGKLPTLIGAEYTFSFENMNIERGLLWNQENAVNRGVQVNYTAGPVALAVSYNDGLYSNKYNWLWGSVAYTINSSNTLSLIGGGSLSRTAISSSATPLYLNNEEIFNLIYTHISGSWTIQPYLQYTKVPQSPLLGTTQDASTFGAALLVNYAVPNSGFSIPVRGEYISSSGDATQGAPNLMYGVGSNAWSVTVTPTYQYKRFFTRAEFSYVQANKTTPGAAFGSLGNDNSQVRGLLEIGILF